MTLAAMIATFFDKLAIASVLFLGYIHLIMESMLPLTRKIQIAKTALNVHLSDLKPNQEWKQYLKPERRYSAPQYKQNSEDTQPCLIVVP